MPNACYVPVYSRKVAYSKEKTKAFMGKLLFFSLSALRKIINPTKETFQS